MKPSQRALVGKVFLIAACLTLGDGLSAAEKASEPTRSYKPEPVFSQLELDRPLRLQPFEGGFLVLDRGNHRLLKLSRDGQIQKQIAQVGQAPGELRHPRDYGLDGQGNVYVITGTVPFAIHTFDRQGTFKSVIYQGETQEDAAYYSSSTIGVEPKGSFLLSQPRQEFLLARYAASGKKKGGIGEKLTPGRVHGESCRSHPLCQDRRYALTLNRVLIETVKDGSVVVATETAPIVRKYSPEGSLEFETRLAGGVVPVLDSAQWETPEGWNYYSFSADGVQVLRLITGLSVDPATGLIYCMVGAREIFVLSPRGEQLAIFEQDLEKPRSLESITVHDGIAYMTDWRYLFQAKLPAVVQKR